MLSISLFHLNSLGSVGLRDASNLWSTSKIEIFKSHKKTQIFIPIFQKKSQITKSTTTFHRLNSINCDYNCYNYRINEKLSSKHHCQLSKLTRTHFKRNQRKKIESFRGDIFNKMPLMNSVNEIFLNRSKRYSH